MKPVNLHYDAKFFDTVTEGSLRSARVIAPMLMRLLCPHSIVDIGCGRGPWLKAFQEAGVENLTGLDGSHVDRATLLIDQLQFIPTDLSKPFIIGCNADLALCLEVAEHLPHRMSLNLISALTGAAPAVLFSAAIPGQGGTCHINEQWPYYWAGLFEKKNYVRIDCIRPKIAQERAVDWWYRQNMVLFVSQEALGKSVELQGEKQLSDELSMEFILPRVFCNYTYFSGLLRELPIAAWRAVKKRLALR
ncbi:MAG TPA: methyltransferase domain-containing protein [Gemmataceae bacterium]|nr:methyltransferase domain-containing protein [Gemmataceae bacterium]